jgi:hypothetical protein
MLPDLPVIQILLNLYLLNGLYFLYLYQSIIFQTI